MQSDSNSLIHDIQSAQTPAQQLAALAAIGEHFRASGEFHRLFEIRKFESRLRVGLPAFYLERPDGTTDVQSASIEADLLQACREVGELLAQQGRIAEAWTYLKPLDDVAFVRNQFESSPIRDENIGDAIDVCLYHQAHSEFGYGLVLNKLGTCQAISAFDSVSPILNPAFRQILSGQLLRHVGREILEQVQRTVGSDPMESCGSDVKLASRIASFLDHHGDAVARSSPHLDATHLVAIMRIARMTVARGDLELALQLARYGLQLPAMLQYECEPPFETTYADHRVWFQALLGVEAEEAVAHFRQKAVGQIGKPAGDSTWEYFIQFLRMLGRFDDAIQAAIEIGILDLGAGGIAPGWIELGLECRDPIPLYEFFRKQGDLLSLTAVQLGRNQKKNLDPTTQVH